MTCIVPYVWRTPDDVYSTLYVWGAPDDLYSTLCVGDT